MIIDVHSHTWKYPAHFSDDFRQQAKRAKAGIEMDLTVENGMGYQPAEHTEEINRRAATLARAWVAWSPRWSWLRRGLRW